MSHNKETTTMSSNNMFSKGKKSGHECELRPGGMLVQKRDSNSDRNSDSAALSTIMVKVKYGSAYHELPISSHASFGELKKMLRERTGLHAQDQKLMFKKKERDSKSYLDVERVRDGSKLVLFEKIESRERRMLETLRIAKKEKASKSLKEINHQVQPLAHKVRRVQKHIETLDTLKMKRQKNVPQKIKAAEEQQLKHWDSVVVTTKWETFD
ncbi:BAG family molecular chaperone regulator 2-like isoform X2 [Arachis ipaensis]|uniref:BAG family molecular chaperone regulator 2-like isoform X2 n=1 Tax=Arachis ipaensis TaxID=130454 RepID=UPI000A2B4645|nr:BAG family molecular chaperone regulator 2-like isoform X2 [Arachis ipaensis]XP_025628791.1 BAG family molecular chaperone regulator 2 isoform X2 [Arachis hypogaea]QHO19992.1 BAG family molecular chaperone regulator [Arachis hypogaea]